MNLDNIQIPRMVTNPPLPNTYYEKLREEEWHEAKLEKEEHKIALLTEQNELLKEQNQALKEANEASNNELQKSKRLNFFMAVIAVLSLVSSVVFGLLPLLLK